MPESKDESEWCFCMCLANELYNYTAKYESYNSTHTKTTSGFLLHHHTSRLSLSRVQNRKRNVHRQVRKGAVELLRAWVQKTNVNERFHMCFAHELYNYTAKYEPYNSTHTKTIINICTFVITHQGSPSLAYKTVNVLFRSPRKSKAVRIANMQRTQQERVEPKENFGTPKHKHTRKAAAKVTKQAHANTYTGSACQCTLANSATPQRNTQQCAARLRPFLGILPQQHVRVAVQSNETKKWLWLERSNTQNKQNQKIGR